MQYVLIKKKKNKNKKTKKQETTSVAFLCQPSKIVTPSPSEMLGCPILSHKRDPGSVVICCSSSEPLKLFLFSSYYSSYFILHLF